MPCGGIFPTLPAEGHRCFACGESKPAPDHCLIEWDADIHGKCVAEFLKTDEGRIVLDHGHGIVVDIEGTTTVVQEETP